MITTLVYRDFRLAGHNPPPGELASLRGEQGVMLWIDLADPTPEEIKLILESTFQFHPLAIEDCIQDSPLPKLEEYDDHLYLVMHAVDYTKTEHFTTTEIDLFLGRNFLVTVHRKDLKPVQAAIDRYLRSPATLVRGPDRFAHALLDLMVEAYKPALAELQQDLDRIESGALRNLPSGELFPQVVALRKELSLLRRTVKPQREIAIELAAGKTKLIRPLIVPYLRDLAEELSRIENQSQVWAEQLILAFRIYLNKSSHEAGEGIRILTAITALPLPILAIGAWYGMNYRRMPELGTSWGYPIAFVTMLAGTVAMLWIMRRKRWL